MKYLRLISVVLTMMTALVSFSSERDSDFFKQGPLFYSVYPDSVNVFATGPDYDDLVGYITVPGIVIHDGVEYTVKEFYAHSPCAAPDSMFFSNRLVNVRALNFYSGLEYNKIYPDRMDTVEVESRPPYYSHTRIVDLPSGIKSIVDYGLDAHFIDTLICRADTPPEATELSFYGFHDHHVEYFEHEVFKPLECKAPLVLVPDPEAYRRAEGWKVFERIEKIPLTMTTFYAGGLKYRIHDEHSVVLAAVDPLEGPDTIIVPATVEYKGMTYNVRAVAYRAFFDAEFALAITLPKSIETVEADVWGRCWDMRKLTIESPVPPVYHDSIGAIPDFVTDSCTLYVPGEALAAYRSAPGWSEFRDIRPIRSDLTSVSGDVYAGPTAVYSSTGVLLRTLPEGTEADDACRDLPAGVYVVRGPAGVRKIAR